MEAFKGFGKGEAWVSQHGPGDAALIGQLLQILLVWKQYRADATGFQICRQCTAFLEKTDLICTRFLKGCCASQLGV